MIHNCEWIASALKTFSLRKIRQEWPRIHLNIWHFLSGLKFHISRHQPFPALDKMTSFSYFKQMQADANNFTSPGPHLKSGFRVVAQLTLGHRPHLRIPTGGNSGQLLGQNCISSKRAFSPANVSHQTPKLVLGLAVLGNSNNWSENASLQRQY